jgi:hypothetical protein
MDFPVDGHSFVPDILRCLLQVFIFCRGILEFTVANAFLLISGVTYPYSYAQRYSLHLHQ